MNYLFITTEAAHVEPILSLLMCSFGYTLVGKDFKVLEA
jgi:hypothetical protein